MEKPVWNNVRRVNHQNSPRITHPNLKRHMAPRKNLTRPKAVINRFNDVKASACWVWKPIKPNTTSITLKRYDYGNSGTKLEDSVRTKRSRDSVTLEHEYEYVMMGLTVLDMRWLRLTSYDTCTYKG
nr:hypothetical protein [Tanacetum cinerariifolium]GFA07412.1 hypothetical protein [Tanacetum cinerariifolium]GFA07413.1 hypothetical protein [Tanacetum cinerariifolium]